MPRHNKKYDINKILLDTSRIVSSTLDMNKVSELVLDESIKALRADHASLFLLEEESGRMVLARAKGFSGDELDNIKLLGSWEVITGQLLKKKRPFVVNDADRSSIFKNKTLPFSMEKLPIRSFLAVPLQKEGGVVGALIVSNKTRPGHHFKREDVKLLAALSNYIAIALLNAKLYHDLNELFISTVKSLVQAIDAKDPYTCGHSERVMRYTLAIGREMGLEDKILENLGLSGILHDVGKIGIKEGVLGKPGRLTPSERRQINQHPLIGVKIVRTIKDSQKIIRGILEHHERVDGKGYPNRLSGKAISLEGRIIALADTFDALTSNRPYRRGFTPKEAVFEIVNGSSHQFDGGVVRAFLASFSKHPGVWNV